MSQPTGPRIDHGKGKPLAIAGDLNTILLDGTDTGGAYALIRILTFPGQGPPPHVHGDVQESFYVQSGEVTFLTKGKIQIARPGEVVHVPAGAPHTFRNASRGAAILLVIAAPAGLERFFAEVGRPVTDASKSPGPPTPEEIERLLAAAPRYGIDIVGPEALEA